MDNDAKLDRAVERSRANDVDAENDSAESIAWTTPGRRPLTVELYSDDSEIVFRRHKSVMSIGCIDEPETRETLTALVRIVEHVLKTHT